MAMLAAIEFPEISAASGRHHHHVHHRHVHHHHGTSISKGTSAAAAAVSSAASAGECDPYEVITGKDCLGDNLFSAHVASTTDCCSACTKNSACAAWTYKKGVCYAKSGCGGTKSDKECTTGRKRSPGPGPAPPPPPPAPAPPSPPSPTPPSPTPPLTLFCPSKDDLSKEYGSGTEVVAGGWSIHGGGRVRSAATFNLLGGYIEWDYDVSGAHSGVNNNLYVTAPDHKKFPKCVTSELSLHWLWIRVRVEIMGLIIIRTH
eukprot:SAG25_NODE_505_length_7318_cov_6.778917_5_plen_260_part_00